MRGWQDPLEVRDSLALHADLPLQQQTQAASFRKSWEWMAFLSWMGLIVLSWYSPKFTVFSKSQGYSSGTITMNCNTRNSKFQILHTEGRLRGPFSQGHSRAEANYVKCPETGSEWVPFLASCQYPNHWHTALITLSPVFRMSFSDWYGCVYAPREGILKREKKRQHYYDLYSKLD